jgi:hypothetical protein
MAGAPPKRRRLLEVLGQQQRLQGPGAAASEGIGGGTAWLVSEAGNGPAAAAPAPQAPERGGGHSSTAAAATWPPGPGVDGSGAGGSAALTTGAGRSCAGACSAGTAAAANDADADADADADEALAAAPSDVEAALLLLKDEVYGRDAPAVATSQPRPYGRGLGSGGHDDEGRAPRRPPPPPVILKAQIYTVLPDRTSVDRELDALLRCGAARAFKLGTGADDYAVLLMADYQRLIDAAITAAGAPGGGGGGGGEEGGSGGGHAAAAAAALQRFRERVVPQLWDSQVAAPRLLQLLARPPGAGRSQQQDLQQQAHSGSGGSPVAGAFDADISHLLAAELLSRDSSLPGQLTLTVPGAGRIVRYLVDGRTELTAALAKKR